MEMAQTRKERVLRLQEKLKKIPGVKDAYFQPPPSVKMKYPCIRFSLDDDWTLYADNQRYSTRWRYSVVVIDRDPLSEIPIKVMDAFRHVGFDRFYTADNLNHYVMTLYD